MKEILTLLLLSTTWPVLANSVDPDQLASKEANWSGSALFVIKYVNFYQKPGSSNQIGWKLEVGVASYVCVEVLQPSQPNGVMSSAVSLPNHTFTGQA